MVASMILPTSHVTESLHAFVAPFRAPRPGGPHGPIQLDMCGGTMGSQALAVTLDGALICSPRRISGCTDPDQAHPDIRCRNVDPPKGLDPFQGTGCSPRVVGSYGPAGVATSI
eukprot:4270276-Pyramimonas_sp.AAC.1